MGYRDMRGRRQRAGAAIETEGGPANVPGSAGLGYGSTAKNMHPSRLGPWAGAQIGRRTGRARFLAADLGTRYSTVNTVHGEANLAVSAGAGGDRADEDNGGRVEHS